MSSRSTGQRALNALAHPISIAAMAGLLLNALVLQPDFPSWWTGKLGDGMWLIFFPFLVALCLAWFVPDERVAGLAALGIVGLGFGAVKTIPTFNAFAAQTFLFVTGVPAKLALDPTDLIALPSLFVAGWIWYHTRSTPLRVRPWLALAFAAFAVAADAPAPQNLGITCLGQQGTTVFAYDKLVQNYHGTSTYYNALASTDGGMSWNPDNGDAAAAWQGLDKNDPCKGRAQDSTWTLRDPKNSSAQYLFLGKQGIYYSNDAGKTLKQEHALGVDEVVLDAVVDPGTGNVVAASGSRMILVRTPNGTWNTVSVLR